MPRGKQFSHQEVLQIWMFKSEGKTPEEIAAILGRTRQGISAILKKGLDYAPKARSGRPKVTTPAMDRRLVRYASTQTMSAAQIKAVTATTASLRTVQRRLSTCSHLKYVKMAKKPPLTPRHKQQRLEWCREHMSWKAEWKFVLFSDEKKFNLDGPDGWASYWHDLRKEKRIFFSRAQGGGSVMVWAAFGSGGKTDIVFMNGRQDSRKYQEVLEKHLLPTAPQICGQNWRFQQDNAPIHTSRSTKAWFEAKNVSVLDWPARSPDLNPVENLWGVLARKVYKGCRQFSNVADLKQSIQQCWAEIDNSLLERLIASMPHRVFHVINKNGNTI